MGVRGGGKVRPRMAGGHRIAEGVLRPQGRDLRPTCHQVPVTRYVHPDEFAALAQDAKALGFPTVYAGPLVRSSFNAFEVASVEGISIA